jgi:SNF2 family DNA or RNA helicase
VSYVPHTKPFDHQLTVWEASRDLEAFAVFWEQGTGKSKLTIDTIGHLYTEGKVDAVIVVAPNGVHRNWVTDELPTHMPPSIDYAAHAYKSESPMTKRQQALLDALLGHRGLMVLAISYDAWMTELGKKLVWKVMKRRKVMLVLDESHRVKTPTARRTRSILAGGKHAPFRRVLSGTPVTNGPFDIYTQVAFVDPGFWLRELNIGSFTAFKSHFGIWEKGWNNAQAREYDVLVGYKNLEELAAAIKLISSRVTKDDVLDLPPKLYTKRYYEMSPAQRRVYDALESDFSAWLEGGELVTAPLAITRMLRLQQVLCGYIPVDGAEEPTELIEKDNNPRLKLLKDTMEDVSGKSIIWATWTRDIDMIMQALRDAGRNPVRYDGTVSDDDRQRAKDAFKHGDATDFVANSQMSEGLTLWEARTVIYYNNSYKLLDRQQSEDRAHRIGQLHPVTYVDLVCPGTRDEDAIAALVLKSTVAETILGDKRKDWL